MSLLLALFFIITSTLISVEICLKLIPKIEIFGIKKIYIRLMHVFNDKILDDLQKQKIVLSMAKDLLTYSCLLAVFLSALLLPFAVFLIFFEFVGFSRYRDWLFSLWGGALVIILGIGYLKLRSI